ncbi:MAG: glycosyltransferase [Phycisphaerales bacterium]|nr:glycosyltransferase [Phycisphaerales bacterium]
MSDSSATAPNAAEPTTASAEPFRECARTNWIGRVNLWLVSGVLGLLGVCFVLTLFWAFTSLAYHNWFFETYRFFTWMLVIFVFLAVFQLFVVQRFGSSARDCSFRPLDAPRVHVGLTAWNDEEAIQTAVREFKACPEVHRVVVVDNDSRDATAAAAQAAGADAVVVETEPGYGACCTRALQEAAVGADVVVLCEGDMTFRAADVKKLLAYLENTDLVLGTRATQELREIDTQMDWLINPCNQIVAKLAQTRFWGTRLTDMGCTYRAMRVDAWQALEPRLSVTGNHFSPHMFIEALKLRMRVIEVPIVFRKRVGLSKGVGNNKLKAAKVAWAMLKLIYRA